MSTIYRKPHKVANVPTYMTHGDPKMVTCQVSQNAFHIYKCFHTAFALFHFCTLFFVTLTLSHFTTFLTNLNNSSTKW